MLQPSKHVLYTQKSSNPWKFVLFRLNRQFWAFFSRSGSLICIWPPPIRAWLLFSLRHTCMAQGRVYGLAGAIHVRLRLCMWGLARLVSYAYGPSHMRMSRYLFFISSCCYPYVRGEAEWPYVYEMPHTRMGRKQVISSFCSLAHALSFSFFSDLAPLDLLAL